MQMENDVQALAAAILAAAIMAKGPHKGKGGIVAETRFAVDLASTALKTIVNPYKPSSSH